MSASDSIKMPPKNKYICIYLPMTLSVKPSLMSSNQPATTDAAIIYNTDWSEIMIWSPIVYFNLAGHTQQQLHQLGQSFQWTATIDSDHIFHKIMTQDNITMPRQIYEFVVNYSNIGAIGEYNYTYDKSTRVLTLYFSGVFHIMAANWPGSQVITMTGKLLAKKFSYG